MLQEFFVTCRMDKWFVDKGSEAHAPDLSRHDAIADAIDAAERLAKPKKRFDVLLKLPGSSSELLWSSKKYFADRRPNRLARLEQPREQETVEDWN
jgi:hypothetical protein